ncbi:hypothetical protein C5167_030596 [Papaver somniferum]|uniref:verprolin-like n=1 Tax=Papaver somniferum TaxID=3469 RepID=UPI000E6FF450|nr:verprolin-like [Papaver somniferum]RZC86515.1 hypothetical protein C5167_030596 [Papaver somniferum]
MEFSSSLRFFLAVTIALSMILQMQTPAAAISCDPAVETSVMTRSTFKTCRRDLEIICQSRSREVSKSEFNFFPTNPDKNNCEGCCQVPRPSPFPPTPPAPVDWKKCRAGDTDKLFQLNGNPKDCNRCFRSCESKCGIARAADQACVRRFRIRDNVYQGLTCACCCRERIVLPPTPPLPLFGPPPPLPLTPTSDNICRPEDTSVGFTISDPPGCSSCPVQCESKCTKLGTSLVLEQCRRGSPSRCKCCCGDNKSPPLPSPPPPPPPSPLPITPIVPPLLAPPPPPSNNKICSSGEKYDEHRSFKTRSCQFCDTDCAARCTSARATMTMQKCTIETKSVLCECCCTPN